MFPQVQFVKEGEKKDSRNRGKQVDKKTKIRKAKKKKIPSRSQETKQCPFQDQKATD